MAADAGYGNEANAKYLFETGVDGYLADTLFRKRDPRFASADPRPKRIQNNRSAPRTSRWRPITASASALRASGSTAMVPMWSSTATGREVPGAQRDCGPCGSRHRCLKHPSRTPTRQFVFFQGSHRASPKPTARRCSARSTPNRAATNSAGAWASWSRCSPTSAARTSSSASACAANARLTRSGCSTAWCTTSARCSDTGSSMKGYDE